MSMSEADRWLLPSRQGEFPARDLIAEETLHGRREATFLVLAASFLVTTTVLVVLGTGRTIDPAPMFAAVLPDLELPIAMLIPLAVIPFPLGGLALTLVCELYGRRRAVALVGTGLVAAIALAGLMRLADLVDGSAASLGPSLGTALGFASCYLVAYLTYVPLFDALRRRLAGGHLWFRLLVFSVVAQLMGWAVFGVVMNGYARLAGSVTQPDTATIRRLAIGSAAYTLACVVLSTLPVSLVARGLRVFLRIAQYDDDDYDDDRGDYDDDYDD